MTTASDRDRVGFFLLPRPAEGGIRERVRAAAVALDALADDWQERANEAYRAARSAALRAWEIDSPAELAATVELAAYLAKRASPAWRSRLSAPEAARSLCRAIEAIESADGGPEGVARKVARRRRLATAAVRRAYDALREAVVAAAAGGYALYRGSYHAPAGRSEVVASGQAQDDDPEAGRRAEAAARRWIREKRAAAGDPEPASRDRTGFFLVPVEVVDSFDETLDDVASRQAFEWASDVSVRSVVLTGLRRDAYNAYADWLERRLRPRCRAFGTYPPKAACTLRDALRRLERRHGGAEGLARAARGRGRGLRAEDLARAHQVLTDMVDAACARGGGLVIVRRIVTG